MALYQSEPSEDAGRPAGPARPGGGDRPPLPILLRVPHFREERTIPPPVARPRLRKKKGRLLWTVLVLAFGLYGLLRWWGGKHPPGGRAVPPARPGWENLSTLPPLKGGPPVEAAPAGPAGLLPLPAAPREGGPERSARLVPVLEPIETGGQP